MDVRLLADPDHWEMWLRDTKAAHTQFEVVTGKGDTEWLAWYTWYLSYVLRVTSHCNVRAWLTNAERNSKGSGEDWARQYALSIVRDVQAVFHITRGVVPETLCA